MKTVGTLFALLLLVVLPVQAQTDVTVRQINEVHPDSLALLNQLGTSLTNDQINRLIQSAYTGQTVRFTAVVLSDPLNSGLSTPNSSTGLPSRIHVFVRDTSAHTLGKAGMDLQLVDGAYQTSGLLSVVKGDVVTITGTVNYFDNTIQLAPTSIELKGPYQNFGLPDDLLAPVLITTEQANKSVGGGLVQVNWDNLSTLNNQYVRVENATVTQRTPADSGRPSWVITSDAGVTILQNDDASLRYRNDRGGQASTFNVRTTPFIPPNIGALVNVQGFLVLRGTFDPYALGSPSGQFLCINPFEDADLEISASAPTITTPSRPATVPGNAPVEVSSTVTPAAGRTLASVVLKYTTSADPTEITVNGNASGDLYTFTVPAVPDGAFVRYYVEATDDTGALANSETRVFRALYDGINSLEDVQLTIDGGPGDSPFRDMTTPMAITATVQTDPGTSGLISLQDNGSLDAWSGVVVLATDALKADLQRGDVIQISNATITESFGLTRLENLTYTKTGSGSSLGYKSFTTDVLQDLFIAEAHEGMMLRFDNVEIANVNPDSPSDFGEFSFTTVGVSAPLRVDDASSQVDATYNDGLVVGQPFAFIQGLWSYTFSNYKLMPETLDDLSTDAEDEAVPATFVLHPNYPNPFNPATTIRYEVGQAGPVTLAVYDLLGRPVTTLVDALQPVGTYAVSFDGQGLASGLYFYRLTAGRQVLSRTMVLVK
jgi:hypothetical protein